MICISQKFKFFLCFGFSLSVSDFALYKVYVISISTSSSRLEVLLLLLAQITFYIAWVSFVFNIDYAKEKFCVKKDSTFWKTFKNEFLDLGGVVFPLLKIFGYLIFGYLFLILITEILSYFYINIYISTPIFIGLGVSSLLGVLCIGLSKLPSVWKEVGAYLTADFRKNDLQILKDFFKENPKAYRDPLPLIFGGLTYVRSTFIIFFLGSLSLRHDNGVSFCGILLLYSHLSFIGCLPTVKVYLSSNYGSNALGQLGFNAETFIPKWASRIGVRGGLSGAALFIGIEFVDTARQFVRQHNLNIDAASETRANRDWNSSNSTKPQKPDVVPKRAERPCIWDDLWGRGKK
jgi:hypothetical protein